MESVNGINGTAARPGWLQAAVEQGEREIHARRRVRIAPQAEHDIHKPISKLSCPFCQQ